MSAQLPAYNNPLVQVHVQNNYFGDINYGMGKKGHASNTNNNAPADSFSPAAKALSSQTSQEVEALSQVYAQLAKTQQEILDLQQQQQALASAPAPMAPAAISPSNSSAQDAQALKALEEALGVTQQPVASPEAAQPVVFNPQPLPSAMQQPSSSPASPALSSPLPLPAPSPATPLEAPSLDVLQAVLSNPESPLYDKLGALEHLALKAPSDPASVITPKNYDMLIAMATGSTPMLPAQDAHQANALRSASILTLGLLDNIQAPEIFKEPGKTMADVPSVALAQYILGNAAESPEIKQTMLQALATAGLANPQDPQIKALLEQAAKDAHPMVKDLATSMLKGTAPSLMPELQALNAMVSPPNNAAVAPVATAPAQPVAAAAAQDPAAMAPLTDAQVQELLQQLGVTPEAFCKPAAAAPKKAA